MAGDGATPRREVRQHAHRLAAEGLSAALNMWELDRYYSREDDQDALVSEMQAIIDRHRKQGRSVV